MKAIPKERLACACFVLEGYAFREDIHSKVTIPIPITSNVMDHYNFLVQETPRLRKFLEEDIQFITTHGRVVHNVEAKKIAIEAGQLDDTGLASKEKLWPNQIWPITK